MGSDPNSHPAILAAVRRHGTVDIGLRVAGLGMAATTGTLVGFGIRRGAPMLVLSAAGDRLRGLPAFVAPDRSFGASAFVGLAHHLALAAAWAFVFTFLAVPLRGAARTVVALLLATIAVSADRLLPPWLCLAAGVASTPQRALLALALCAALVMGMRLAQRME